MKLKVKLYASCLIYGNRTWPIKVEHKVRLDRNIKSMIRWMCGFMLKERKKNTELRELLGLEPVSSVVKRGRLRWSGHVEHKDNGDVFVNTFVGCWKPTTET